MGSKSFHSISVLSGKWNAQVGTLQITLFHSKKWNDKNGDMTYGMVRNCSVLFRSRVNKE